MRLIDADALTEKLEELMNRYAEQGRREVAENYNFAATVLLTAPTIDAVEVVHCRDCEHWVENRGDGYGDGYCASHDGLFAHTKPDDFCSYGERKTE